MIFVAGTLSIDPAQLDAFAADVAEMRPKVLEEEGCRHYSLLVEDAAKGEINVLEIWDSEEHLKVHLTMPWITTFFNRYSPHITGMTAQVYDAANPRAVPL
ncbi:MAG TPA: putative quinol monooxygenase [Novosphingobium sp.]|nr:putative quinol monooxygenase [Novosphingobium sp.]